MKDLRIFSEKLNGQVYHYRDKKLAEKIDRDKMKSPSFLMVITASDYAYQREDGVYVVPIGCLKD